MSDYFAITLTADATSVAVEIETSWKTWRDSTHGIEVREASPAGDGRRWTWLREHHLVVKTRTALKHFVAVGGHALVEGSLLSAWWPAALEPIDCTRCHERMPWISVAHPPKGIYERFARGALRQAVLARDEHRCRLCGRSPDDALDVKLDVHHIVPHANHGMTMSHNLITLCKTCHDGIVDDEHQDALEQKLWLMEARSHRTNHARGVYRYRHHADRAGVTVRPAEPPVLEVDWDWHGPGKDGRLIYIIIMDNAVIRWYPLRKWRRIAQTA